MSDFSLGIVYSPVVSRFALQTFIVLRYSQLSFTFRYFSLAGVSPSLNSK